MADHAKPLEGVTFRTSDLTNTPHEIATWAPCRARRLHICCKGCHFAHATERHRAQTTKPRPGPPPGPQPPDHPFRSRCIAKAGPGGRGLGTVVPSAPCLPLLVHIVIAEHSATNPHPPTTPPTPAPGGGGLPLPAAAAAAPEKASHRRRR